MGGRGTSRLLDGGSLAPGSLAQPWGLEAELPQGSCGIPSTQLHCLLSGPSWVLRQPFLVGPHRGSCSIYPLAGSELTGLPALEA